MSWPRVLRLRHLTTFDPRVQLEVIQWQVSSDPCPPPTGNRYIRFSFCSEETTSAIDFRPFSFQPAALIVKLTVKELSFVFIYFTFPPVS